MNQRSPLPIRKVTYSALTGAILTLAFFSFSHITKRAIDPTVSAAITTIVSFVTSYLVPPTPMDALVIDNKV